MYNVYITTIMEVFEMNENKNNEFLASGSNVQGIARLSLAVPLIAGLGLIVLGIIMLSGYLSDIGLILIIIGVIVIVGGLIPFYLIKAFGELVESNKICARYLEKLTEQNDK